MNITIQNEFTPDLIEGIKEVYMSVGWEKHTPEMIEKIYGRSDIVCIAKKNGLITGVGRALTDGVFNASIYDVVVHADFQGNGIGSLILEDILSQLREISCIMLIATTGNEGFYRKHGMKHVKTGMARYLKHSLENEYLE
ncbi:GNAT family N-acetyltransferase [Bacillus sp. KH172YL63]|uniref:GNAT family N-acetyltransferase n=1 Tax=Bacillus sp. KH172YL63 TaxID=2709784 RepID=UPI0013E5003A|nr:GNAT family N-acetyltransferase [Bacillus sp. KH172YL63]BCB03588.1 hypothetical protein KH172YL63_17210 [Bacillus sp. KH172YL63]